MSDHPVTSQLRIVTIKMGKALRREYHTSANLGRNYSDTDSRTTYRTLTQSTPCLLAKQVMPHLYQDHHVPGSWI